MKFPKKKKERREVFLGSLRCEVDKETEEGLKPLIPIGRRIVEGTVFYWFADGHVEVGGSVRELIDEMVEEIRERDKHG